MRVTPDNFRPKTPSGLIVLDGPNGAGKTTLQNSLIEFLAEHGKQAIATREPGATELGKSIRELLLNQGAERMSELCETFLFAADRAEHVAKVVKPALEQGKWVISDRYYYSTLAFQGFGRGLDIDLLTSINMTAIAGAVPDLVLLLDIDAQLGLSRTRAREASGASENDSFEAEKLDFHKRLRNGFLELSHRLPEPFCVLDASKSPDEVFNSAKAMVEMLLDA